VRDDDAVGDAALLSSQRRFLSRGLLLGLMLVALKIARNLGSIFIATAGRRRSRARRKLT
jgi:hypothetical protein